MQTPDPVAYDAIARYGRPALAWEVLRRDPAYGLAWSRLPAPVAGVAAAADFATSWGLHFR
jgi:hypothetical protein